MTQTYVAACIGCPVLDDNAANATVERETFSLFEKKNKRTWLSGTHCCDDDAMMMMMKRRRGGTARGEFNDIAEIGCLCFYEIFKPHRNGAVGRNLTLKNLIQWKWKYKLICFVCVKKRDFNWCSHFAPSQSTLAHSYIFAFSLYVAMSNEHLNH